MAPLLVLLARQTSLKTLEISDKVLSDAQKDRICRVVSENAPGCAIKFEWDELAMFGD